MKPRINKRKIKKNIFIGISLLFCLLFVIKFSGPALLRFYVETGIGNCRRIPVLCITPQEEIINPAVNNGYLAGLVPYKLDEIRISIPKEFKVIKQKIVKEYYKKKNYDYSGSVIYLIYRKPNFFINLFPQLQRQGIYNDYEFISRVMYASLSNIDGLSDAFFVVMKSIFIPDLGNQHNVKMARFVVGRQQGFISYNIGASGNYFNCDIIQDGRYFFKVYIKDELKALSLEKAFSIISTIEKTD